MDHNEELHRFLTGVQGLAPDAMAEIFLGIDPAQDPETARLAGFVLHAIFIGVMVRARLASSPNHLRAGAWIPGRNG
jgi:hypothetical protein